jgi:hypothetical protein
MKEDFLHYLWQYQLFNKSGLLTIAGEKVFVQEVGAHNINAGPDFLEAKIVIADQLWAGSVEIHLKSSDWYVHHHETNPAYDNVILHVVWEDDMPVFRKNNTPVSTLELKGLVPKSLLNNYKNLFTTKKWIACEKSLTKIESFTWNSWLERLYIEKLENKAMQIKSLLSHTTNNWEAVLFRLLAKNFGLKVNSEAFNCLASSIDFSIIRKERTQRLNLESLLFGQANLLQETKEDLYYQDLQKNYQFQKHKYNLQAIENEVKFFRLRPVNFPSIRLSQLADLYLKHDNLFQQLMQAKELKDFYTLLQSRAGEYWDTHYVFGKESKSIIKKTSHRFIDLLLINTIIPLKYAYQKHIGKQDVDFILQLIASIKPEKNSIINKFTNLDVDINNAQDTQALLHLYKDYCKPKKCLSCRVGLVLMKNSKLSVK